MIVIGTTNKDKVRELAAMLSPLGVDIGQLSLNVPEPGETFEENARLKAVAYSRGAPGKVVLCEDSGLVVPVLGGLPGAWSARFHEVEIHWPYPEEPENVVRVKAPPEPHGWERPLVELRVTTDRRNNERLLSLMRGIAPERRGAYFVCHVALAKDGVILWEAEEKSHGWIATEMRGEEGFGYDPVFVGQDTYGKTYAEVDQVRKGLRSHRKRALDRLYAWLSQNIGLVSE